MYKFGVTFRGSHVSELEPLWVHCATCGHEWAPCLAPAPMDVVATALKKMSKCPLCRGTKGRALMGRTPRETPDGEPLDWLLYSFDTGISSETMWSAIMQQPINKRGWYPGVPHDPEDFGRCYRLMKRMESRKWRQWLPRVSDAYPEWKPFIDAWDELTALYEEELPTGKCPKLYARLQACEKAGTVGAVARTDGEGQSGPRAQESSSSSEASEGPQTGASK